MIHIVLYFWSDYDGDLVFNKIVKFFKNTDYEFAYDCISNQIFFRNTFEDDCRKEVKIDIRYGDACKSYAACVLIFIIQTQKMEKFY